MRRGAVLSLALLFLTGGCAQADDEAQGKKAPRHPISEGRALSDIMPPKPAAKEAEPVRATPPTEPVERQSRQPTRAQRIQPNSPPEPSKSIDMKKPEIREVEPPVPIGTIDPRSGTIRTNPGTIEAR